MSAGTLLIARLRLPLDRAERRLFSFLLGAALLSSLTFLICAAQLARKGVFLAVGVALVAWAARTKTSPDDSSARPPWPRTWKILFFTIAGAYAVLYFFNAMAPEVSPDGSAYHLGLVARYLRERGFHRITTNMYANLSQGVEMLFVFAFVFGRHSAAALVHCAFLLVLPLAMVLYARRRGILPAGVCAALFVFLSPITGIDGVSAYVDVAAACIVFGVFYLLEIWDDSRHAGLLVAIGLLAGFAYAAKYTAGLAVAYAAGFVAWRCWRLRKPVVKPVLVVSACALAVMSPWIVKNCIWLQNPFSPFFNSLFPNPYIQVGFERDYARFMRNYEAMRSPAAVPWLLAVDGSLGGLVGPLFLLAPAGLLAARGRLGRRALAAALIFGATYFLNVGARFLLPALPFLALAMALAFIRWKPLAIALVVAHAALSWPRMTSRYCNPSAWRLSELPVRAALRLEPEERYLIANLPNYLMARLIESKVPPGATVLTLSGAAEAYTKRQILTAQQSASSNVLLDILWTPLVDVFAPEWIREFRFPTAAARRIRVIQTARSPTDQWSISELRVFRGNTELARAPEWRLHAQPNPWEIQLAFDNTLITRWRTWLPIVGGEFVQVDFGHTETIDTVRIECARDYLKVNMKLEGMDANGMWRTLAGQTLDTMAPPLPQLRRMAADELKRRGVDYIAIYGHDFGENDFRSRPERWGFTIAGAVADGRLYRIQ